MDDTPGDVIDDGVVSAGTVKSLFQTGNVGLRVTCDVSWGLRLVVGRGVDREYKLVIAMDERTRQIFERALAATDRGEDAKRKHAEWLESHIDPITLGNMILRKIATSSRRCSNDHFRIWFTKRGSCARCLCNKNSR